MTSEIIGFLIYTIHIVVQTVKGSLIIYCNVKVMNKNPCSFIKDLGFFLIELCVL